MVIVPYVMPGFDLAKLAYEMHDNFRLNLSSKNDKLKGMILLHGVSHLEIVLKKVIQG